MSRTDDKFEPALAGVAMKGRKIPILTLDSKWHQLFTQTDPDKRLKRLEDELNELLKKQGKANTEIKEIKRLKRRLMQEIMDNAQESSTGNSRAQKKAQENKRLIGDCNEKIMGYEDELLGIPRQIDQINRELMLITMEICYSRLHENRREIEEISQWVSEIRTELKEKLVKKQEMESANQALYSYMHDIFGADVIDIFDMRYEKNEDSEDSEKWPQG